MTYKEFQQYLAKYGFLKTPMSEEEYASLKDYSDYSCYRIACDLTNGLSFNEALEANFDR